MYKVELNFFRARNSAEDLVLNIIIVKVKYELYNLQVMFKKFFFQDCLSSFFCEILLYIPTDPNEISISYAAFEHAITSLKNK